MPFGFDPPGLPVVPQAGSSKMQMTAFIHLDLLNHVLPGIAHLPKTRPIGTAARLEEARPLRDLLRMG
jgi:hypothetical protein